MKINRLVIALLLTPLSIMLFNRCSDDIIDKTPKDRIQAEDVWGDLNLATLFLNETYNGVQSGFSRGFFLLASATDESENDFDWANSTRWNMGDFSISSVPKFYAPWDDWWAPSQWKIGYEYIRKTNVFLARIDGVPGDEEKKKVLKGEALFLRALFYHDLIKFHGTAVLIDTELGIEDTDELLEPRSSFEACVDFIIADLDAAAALLPIKREGDEVGRATKAAALALAGRQLLYAERYTKAAEYSKQVMEMTEYSLFPNYEEMFWAKNNNNAEVIFSKQYKSKDKRHDALRDGALITFNGWGGTQPTQNLVDKYEMIDGMSIDDSPLYDETDPYKDRDPRLKATILYDGTIFYDPITKRDREIELREGGKEGIDTGHGKTRTGYNLRKFMDPLLLNDLGDAYNNWIVIRLAEVLLNYAEAQNESAGPDGSVYEAINMVRQRPGVNMPPLAGLTKETMREKIRQERTVELAFEEHRFFDLRRWKENGTGSLLAETVLNESVYGMRISNDKSTYTRFKLEDRVYLPKHRFFPVAQGEIDINPDLGQTPGW